MASESANDVTRQAAGSARGGGRFVARLAGVAAGAGGVAVFAFLSQASTWAEYARTVAGLLMVAGCAWSVGGLVGFLFGIPRTLSLPSGDSKRARSAGASCNTGSTRTWSRSRTG